jgi:hypothetical protein
MKQEKELQSRRLHHSLGLLTLSKTTLYFLAENFFKFSTS